MNTVVWVMVTLATINGYNVGPEFNSKEKCEVAAQEVYKAVAVHKAVGAVSSILVSHKPIIVTFRKPICVKIEK